MPQTPSAKTLADYVRDRVPELHDQPDHLLVKYLFDKHPEFKTDTLQASRTEANRQEFESNQPESTVLSRWREAAIGRIEPFTAGNMLETAKGVAGTVGKAVMGNYSGVAQDIGGMAKGVVAPIGDYASAVKAGDWDKAANASGRILTTTVPVLAGPYADTPVGKVPGAILGDVGSAAKGIGKAAVASDLAIRSKPVTNAITAPRINAILEIPQSKIGAFSKINPGQRIIADKIVAGTQKGLLKQMQLKLQQIGPQLEHKLTQEGRGGRVNAETYVDNAIAEASKDIDLKTVEGFEKGLDNLRASLAEFSQKEFGKPLSDLNPLEAQRLKSHLGKTTKYRGIPAETGLNQVRMQIYGDLMNDIERQVPGSRDVLHAWGDYEVGTNALQEKVQRSALGSKRGEAGLRIKGVGLPTNTFARTALGRVFRPSPEPPPPFDFSGAPGRPYDPAGQILPPQMDGPLLPGTTQVNPAWAAKPDLEPYSDPTPRDIQGQVLGLEPGEGATLPGTTAINPRWQAAPAPAPYQDQIPRDVHGQILPRPGGPLTGNTDAYVPGTRTPNPHNGGPPERLIDQSRRDPITGELLLQPSMGVGDPALPKPRGPKLPTRPVLEMADPILDEAARRVGSAAQHNKLMAISRDVSTVHRLHGRDVMENINTIVTGKGGSTATIVQIMERPEGMTVIQSLVRAYRRSAVKDVMFLTKRLESLVEREIRRNPPPAAPPISVPPPISFKSGPIESPGGLQGFIKDMLDKTKEE